ncbi:Protein of unknown function (DUF3292) domain containing protein [Hyaloscypha variabilis]
MNSVADSHDLAIGDHEIKGEAQEQPISNSGAELQDLGWHKDLADIPPLIGGVANGKLFALIRRFNKDVFDVRAVPVGNTSALDLTEAWDDDHSTDKITLHLQRFYLSVVLGLASFAKQMSRLRSWNERSRTTAFCIAYILAWVFNLLIPLGLVGLLVIVGSEKARNILFPPAPLALVHLSTGELQKPQAGQLGSIDTLTGAPEKAEREAREEEAANFVDNFRHIIARAVGMHENKDGEGDPLESKVPKSLRKVIKSVKTAGSAPGHAASDAEENMTQKPMEEMLWDNVQPRAIEPIFKNMPHVIGEIVDNWERFANAISPTRPFSRLPFLRIEGALSLLFLTSLFVPQYVVYKGTGLVIGFGLFGDPVISACFRWLTESFPSNILRGVPTNNQLTLTLLRIGEVHNSPLPPVPPTKSTDDNNPHHVHIDQIPLNASHHDFVQAIEPSPMPKTDGNQSSSPDNSNSKGTASKATVEAKLVVDHARAVVGSSKAQGHLGVLPKKKTLIYAGPGEFKARFEGKKGWLYLTSETTSSTNPTRPRLIFVTEDPRNQKSEVHASEESKTLCSIALQDIYRLKRATAFINKPVKKAASWSEDTELLASLEIENERGGTIRFTAIPERDALFNRLIALGNQR